MIIKNRARLSFLPFLLFVGIILQLTSCSNGGSSTNTATDSSIKALATDNSYLDVPPQAGQKEVSAANYFPVGFSSDGSVGYMPQIQMALRYAARWNLAVVFPAMTYLIDNEDGLEVYSGLTIDMRGAVLKTTASFARDGQIFRGQDLQNVTFSGGEIAGARDKWADSTNIVGIKIVGRSAGITIRDIYIHHLSSNAVRICGTSYDNPATNITISNLHADHCCGVYVDYLQPNPGPAPGTVREDTGNIVLYYVNDFRVDSCLLENSHADGTHFCRCNRGSFTNNTLRDNHMGGYFLEECSYIDADRNTISGSGSRGVSIEGGSSYWTFTNNTVSNSGREGLWSIASLHSSVTGNTFADNGRKNDAAVDANILIDNTMGAFSRVVQSQDMLIEGNLLVTAAFQSWAIRVSSTCIEIRIQHNELQGDNRIIRADAWISGIGTVFISDNNGWKTDNSGTTFFTGDGKTISFSIPHGLDISDPNNPDVLSHAKIVSTFLINGLSADYVWSYTAGINNLNITFTKPPPAGCTFQVDWTAVCQQKI